MPTVRLRRVSVPTSPFRAATNSGTLGMVFHGRGISLGVRQHLALRINNRSAGPGGPAFLPSDILQRAAARAGVWPILGQRAHAVHLNGEHLRLLPEIALDLLAAEIFPGMANREIEGHRGRAQSPGRRQPSNLKNIRFLTSGPRSGSRPPARSSGSADFQDRVRFSRECGARKHPPNAA